MSIPMYFAQECIKTHNNVAQVGFGFREDGSFSAPEQIIEGAPIIINDAVIPKQLPTEDTVYKIKKLSGHGCFLDFERPLTDFHTYLMKMLPKSMPMICCQAPVHSWMRFCEIQQKLLGTWVWEILPWSKSLTFPWVINDGTLPYSCCKYAARNNVLTIYDTRSTIQTKLEIAEQYGCNAGVILPSDYEKTQP